MATPEILNFEKLLAPISLEQHSGIELTKDEQGLRAYHQVRQDREEARRAERKMAAPVASQDPSMGNVVNEEDPRRVCNEKWKSVAANAQKILSTQSKDLTITAWLIEALTRQHGFAGLRDGFRLARQISETFWDDIHPAPDEDEGYIETLNQFIALNGDDSEGALIAPINNIPLARLSTDDVLRGADYFYAMESTDSFVDPTRRAEIMAMIDLAKQELSAEYIKNLEEDVQGALDEFQGMTAFFDKNCPPNRRQEATAPPSTQIRDELQRSLERVRQLKGEYGGSDAVDADESAATTAAAGGATPAKAAGSGGPLQSREDAFRQLSAVAGYFRKNEPHSPVSYALEQVVRWGKMSLPELLKDLIADDSMRRELTKRTGVPLEDDD